MAHYLSKCTFSRWVPCPVMSTRPHTCGRLRLRRSEEVLPHAWGLLPCHLRHRAGNSSCRLGRFARICGHGHSTSGQPADRQSLSFNPLEGSSNVEPINVIVQQPPPCTITLMCLDCQAEAAGWYLHYKSNTNSGACNRSAAICSSDISLQQYADSAWAGLPGCVTAAALQQCNMRQHHRLAATCRLCCPASHLVQSEHRLERLLQVFRDAQHAGRGHACCAGGVDRAVHVHDHPGRPPPIYRREILDDVSAKDTG